MNRRSFLASATVVATGCLGAGPARPSTLTSSPPQTSVSGAEYQLSDLAVDTSTDELSAKYVIEPTAYYSADAVAREREQSDAPLIVMNVSSVDDPEVRDLLETAMILGHWRGNDLPAGTRYLLNGVDFFTGVFPEDATHSHISLKLYELNPTRPPPIEFDATISRSWVAPDHSGEIVFTLTNTGESVQTVHAGPAPPFGVLRATHVSTASEFLLWHDYGNARGVTLTSAGVAVFSIGSLVPLPPGATISRGYRVLPSTTSTYPDRTVPPESGRYRTGERISYTGQEGVPESTLSATVEFDLVRP